jgi:choline-sulfatase
MAPVRDGRATPSPSGLPRPNLVLLITDQQRAPMHWPDESGWLDALAPNDAELRRSGVSFTHACAASAMCSPSRASFLTGTYPSRHGVTLTLTTADLRPDPRHLPAVLAEVARLAVAGDVPRERLARAFLRGLFRVGPHSGGEPELPARIPTLGSRLKGAGYAVVYKGKWHLTAPLAGAHEWSEADAERIGRDYGFDGWEPPDAGENVEPSHFGGGTAGRSGMGWDEDFVRQAEAFLAREDLPEPFCLIVSLVNPHDVLGYPDSFRAGGYRREQFADLGVPLPPTIDEALADKPSVHSLMKLGQISYIGPLDSRDAQLDYVNFYAHLHRLVDEKIGRLLAALGDPRDPGSLRARTVIARISDHGEMGLSHGGLRQKMFNAYEETIRVPLVISNPLLFPRGAETDAPASLVDVLPTLLCVAGAGTEEGADTRAGKDASAGGGTGASPDGALDGVDLCGVLGRHARAEREALRAAGVDFAGVLEVRPEESAREHVLFTYDDHQAATAQQEAPGQPNRIRCIRDRRWKYAVYLDPRGEVAPEHELYDLDADPNEVRNLLDKRTGSARTPSAAREKERLQEALTEECLRTRNPAPRYRAG